jgi:hypothetical protein
VGVERPAGDEDLERRRLAHQAATHAYLYAGAVKFQVESLLADDPPEMPEGFADLRSAARQAQAMVLVLALRNVLRAAEMALQYADPAERPNLESALSRFREALPDLMTARNMLEHFDDYLTGSGRAPHLYDVEFERANGRYLIHIGPATVEASTALEEARHLSGNAIAVAWRDWGYPVGNETTQRGRRG